MHFKYRKVLGINIKVDSQREVVTVPQFNWKLLKFATAMGGDDHTVFRLQRYEPPKESQIIQLKSNEDIVGFIIPGAALLSTSHLFSKSPMFGPFALITINHILAKAGEDLSVKKRDSPKIFDEMARPLSLEQFVDVNTFYCVFNSGCEAKSAEEFIDFYFPQLMANGFFSDSQIKNFSQGKAQPLDDKKSINLKKSSVKSKFVRKALFDIIPHEQNSFFAFFYAWQVVEFFMQTEFDKRILKFMEKYKSTDNIVNVKKALDGINEIAKEKNRVCSVFLKNDEILSSSIIQIYNKIEKELSGSDIVELKAEECIAVVKEEAVEEGKVDIVSDFNPVEDGFALKLYYIRNVMFHSFSTIEKFKDSMDYLIDSLSRYLANKCAS